LSRLFFDVTEHGATRLLALPAKGTVLIGTDPAADVRLASDGVFGEHARLSLESLAVEALAPGL